MSLRCRLGIHRFVPFAYNSVVEPVPVEKCERCGIGRKLTTYGAEIRYSAEQMQEAEDDLRRREAEQTA